MMSHYPVSLQTIWLHRVNCGYKCVPAEKSTSHTCHPASLCVACGHLFIKRSWQECVENPWGNWAFEHVWAPFLWKDSTSMSYKGTKLMSIFNKAVWAGSHQTMPDSKHTFLHVYTVNQVKQITPVPALHISAMSSKKNRSLQKSTGIVRLNSLWCSHTREGNDLGHINLSRALFCTYLVWLFPYLFDQRFYSSAGLLTVALIQLEIKASNPFNHSQKCSQLKCFRPTLR